MLASKISSIFFSKSNRAIYTYFVLSILLGFSVGFYFFENTGNFPLPMMRVALCYNVSIVSLLCSTFIPLLLSFCAVYFSKQWLIYVICFWKMFSFGFSTNCFLHTFSSAGWLVQTLSMVSDLVALMMLTWFCVRNLRICRHSYVRDLLVAVSVIFPICVADYFYFSPFVASLFFD